MARRHCLVWVRGTTGPQPQIWAPEAFEVTQGRIDAYVIAIHELSAEEQSMPLRSLAARYPLSSGSAG